MSVVKALESLQLETKKVLVACSGGLDSTVLVHALASLNIPMTLFHVNYHLRGDESNLDQAFVESLGKTFDCPVQIEHCPKNILYGDGINLQQAARTFRRTFFEEWTAKSEQHVVLVAHHADDQVETFFLQLARGAGIFGLGGMHPEQAQMIRPFLELTKSDLERYAVDHKITWREDRSNKENDYLRNRFRNVFLPEMEKAVPELRKSVLILQEVFRTEQETLITSVQELVNDWEKDQIIILSKWKKLTFEQKMAFTKALGFEHWLIERLDTSERLQLSATIDLGFTSLVKVKNALKQVNKESEKKLWEFKIEGIEILPKSFSKDVIYLDSSKIVGTLRMRFATADDVIHPIGMKGKQNVFKILKESGITKQERGFQQVLCDDQQVLWIPGYKISRKAIATDSCSSILQISLKEI